jgi:predicted nucleic acid-binding protein
LPKRSAKTAKTVSERRPEGFRFFDASAAAKAYLAEPESAHVRAWMLAGGVVISRLSVVEIPSAIHRRSREGFISRRDRDMALDVFFSELERWEVIELTDDVARGAVALLAAHRLRAGDAIQLASALKARAWLPHFSRLVAYDALLLNAARAEGLPTEEY